jgi:hypothetical protein
VTCYRLDSLGFEPQWQQEIFSCLYLSRLALRPTQPSTQWVQGTFTEVKWWGCVIGHPPLSSDEVKNEWRYTSTPTLWQSWYVTGWPLPIPLEIYAHICHRRFNEHQQKYDNIITVLEKLTVTQLVKKFLAFLCKLEFHYHIHNSSLLDLIPSQMNPVHILPPHFFKIHFYIIVPYMPVSSKQSVSYGFSE